MDPVAGAARAAQALRPGGRVALFWNVGQPSPEVAEAFAAVSSEVLPDLPAYTGVGSALAGYQVMVDEAADGIRRSGAFAEPEQWRFDWQHPYTRDEWLDQVPTFGTTTRLPPQRLQALLTGIGEVLDEVGGRFTMNYTTAAVTTTRHR